VGYQNFYGRKEKKKREQIQAANAQLLKIASGVFFLNEPSVTFSETNESSSNGFFSSLFLLQDIVTLITPSNERGKNVGHKTREKTTGK